MLHAEGRHAELLDDLAAWIRRSPAVPTPYQQYLSVLLATGRVTQAEALVARWLEEGRQRAEALPPDVAARLQAAVWLATGQGNWGSAHWPDQRWDRALGDTVLALARCHPWDYPDYVNSSGIRMADDVMRSWSDRFGRSWPDDRPDAYYRVIETAARRLRDRPDKLLPQEVEHYVDWIADQSTLVEPGEWKRIAAVLRRRWDAEPDPNTKSELGQALGRVLSEHVGAGEWIAFLRADVKAAPDSQQSGNVYWLFEAILSQPWSEAYESEALSLLEKLTSGGEPALDLAGQISALYRLTDLMVEARVAARSKAIEHPERLTRTQRRATDRENLRLAREGLADHLRRASARTAPALAPWMLVEATYLDVLSGRNLDKVAEECFRQLGPPPAALAAQGSDALRERRESRTLEQQLDDIRRDRCLISLIRLAVRNAKADLGGRVSAYLEHCQATDPDEPRWKHRQYQLLVALDRPEDLEKKLRQWIGAGDPSSAWQLTLGRLLAERGRLAEAIQLFERVRAADELSSPDYRALAAWYTVTDQREAAERAAVAAFQVEDEESLAAWFQEKLEPWQRGDPDEATPRELEAEVPWAFVAVLEKSSYPARHLAVLREFYRATCDLLASLGAIGEPRLAAEQVGEMESLYRSLSQGSTDRLPVAASLAEIHWAYGHHDAAIDLVAAALKEHQETSGGALPAYTNKRLSKLISWLEERQHWVRAESVLRDQLAHPASRQQANWLTQQLYELWDEGTIAVFGRACQECGLPEAAIGYFREAIACHRQAGSDRGRNGFIVPRGGRYQPIMPHWNKPDEGRLEPDLSANGGPGAGGLAGYWASLARAYSELGRTAEAVDAAASAIVQSGPDDEHRFDCSLLEEVIEAAPDLDAYVEQYMRQVKENGLENPFVRKAIGRAYAAENQGAAKAIQHLRIAVELLPNDRETREELIGVLDSEDMQREAIGQLLRLCELARRDIDLYADLGRRLDAIGEPQEAERAYTSMVEVLPAEAESHHWSKTSNGAGDRNSLSRAICRTFDRAFHNDTAR